MLKNQKSLLLSISLYAEIFYLHYSLFFVIFFLFHFKARYYQIFLFYFKARYYPCIVAKFFFINLLCWLLFAKKQNCQVFFLHFHSQLNGLLHWIWPNFLCNFAPTWLKYYVILLSSCISQGYAICTHYSFDSSFCAFMKSLYGNSAYKPDKETDIT